MKLPSLEEIVSKQKSDASTYKVNICLTVYNKEKYLKQSLDSLLSQRTNFEYQIVAGDDCSKDSSREILKEYEAKYPNRIKLVFHENNKGVNENRNILFKSCNAPYLAICDADDYWIDENALQKKVDFLENHPMYMGYTSSTRFLRGEELSEYTDFDQRGLICKDRGIDEIKFPDYTLDDALYNKYPGQIGGYLYRNIFKYMSDEAFMAYTSYALDEHGKLPIVAGLIGPTYRQDNDPLNVYRYTEGSLDRTKENQNQCKSLWDSHLLYIKMVEDLSDGNYKMNLDEQLKVLAVNSFMTAFKNTLKGKGKDDRAQFSYIKNNGALSKKDINEAIRKHIFSKLL